MSPKLASWNEKAVNFKLKLNKQIEKPQKKKISRNCVRGKKSQIKFGKYKQKLNPDIRFCGEVKNQK